MKALKIIGLDITLYWISFLLCVLKVQEHFRNKYLVVGGAQVVMTDFS
jgi:hypothetical protein